MKRSRHTWMLTLLAAVCLAAGCERSKVSGELVLDHAPDDLNAEMEFWHTLADRPMTSNDEALHGLIIFQEGSDPNADYAQRLAWMKDKGFLPQDFNQTGDTTVERGTVASVMVQMLKIKGGLTMRVIGPHPRYAAKELVYLRIMTPGSPQQGVSGIQFVGILSQAEKYLERHNPQSQGV